MKKVLSLASLLLIVSILSGCKKADPAKIPGLSTTPVTDITATSATSGGTITSDGGAAISVRGICWSTTANPSTSDSKTSDGDGTGQFVSSMTGLTAGSTYHVRAYATNSIGTAYGDDVEFATTGSAPTATTNPATSITASGATLNGIVNANEITTTVTFEYGTSTSYGQTAAAIPGQVTGDANFPENSALTGLTANTTYHFRIKAVNSVGLTYGSDLTFTTSAPSSQVTDIDGNVYNTVTIGTQVWLKENLKATKFNDGTAIPNITDNTAWNGTATAAYCDYSNTLSNSSTYGRLYNWYTVASSNPKNVCPTGWHVPTDTEWTTLINFLGGEGTAGGKLKETGTTYWLTPNTAATNESGFTAYGAGYRSETGTFGLLTNTGFLWSSTEGGTTFAWNRYLYYGGGIASRGDMDKHNGVSVRCMKN